jgi:hypothetical protein
MKRVYLNLAASVLLVFLLSSCASQSGSVSNNAVGGAASPDEFWDRTPNGTQLIFIGVAARQSNPKDGVRLAVENAARQVALFLRVEGSYKLDAQYGGGELDYRADAITSLSFDEGYTKHVASLQYDEETDVLRDGNAVFVRTRYSSPVAISVPFSPSKGGARPEWVDSMPTEMGVYMVGIGQAGNRSWQRDTMNISHENAILSIIRNYDSKMKTDTKDKSSGGGSGTRSSLSASGVVQSFYILETWTDPQNKAVWTLGIAPKP